MLPNIKRLFPLLFLLLTTGQAKADNQAIYVPPVGSGAGAPTATAPNGTAYLRTDASGSSDAIYMRVGGAWTAIGGGGSLPSGTDTQTLRFNGTTLSSTSSILNNGSQVAVGGSLDTGARLSVAPSGTAENGITVTLPASATGNSIKTLDSNGAVRFSVGNAQPYFSVKSYSGSVGTVNTTGGTYGPGIALDGNDQGNAAGTQVAYLAPYYNAGHNLVGIASNTGLASAGSIRADGGFNTSTGGNGMLLTDFTLSRGGGISLDFVGGATGGQALFYFHSIPLSAPGGVMQLSLANNPSYPGLVINSDASQTGDILQANDSNGTSNLAKITSTGKVISAVGYGAPMTTPSATTTTPSTVTKWMQVYDASGNSVGYVAVYSVTP